VQDLVEKMQSGQFDVVDARAKDHHGKLYIIDHQTAIIASSVPTLTSKATSKLALGYDSIEMRKRWENLMERHGESRKLIDLPVLTSNKTEEVDLLEMASQVKIKSGQLNLEALADFDISPFYQHKAKLQLNRNYAKTLPDDILSAKTYSKSSPSVYILLLYQQEYHGIVYYPETHKVQEPDIVELLDLIVCEENTTTASVEPDLIEALSDAGIRAWCDKKRISPKDIEEDVERICTLYLQPETEDKGFEDYLREVLQN